MTYHEMFISYLTLAGLVGYVAGWLSRGPTQRPPITVHLNGSAGVTSDQVTKLIGLIDERARVIP